MGLHSLIAVFTLLIFAGGNKDLLDFVETKYFWQTQEVEVTEDQMLLLLAGKKTAVDASKLIEQLADDDFDTREDAFNKLKKLGAAIKPQLEEGTKSDDPEVAERCKELIKVAKEAAQNKDVTELMAIRTLGELKSVKAKGVLQKIVKEDKRPFFKAYAERAIANIEGKAIPKKQLTFDMIASDVEIMPKDTGIVGQALMLELDKTVLQAQMSKITKDMINSMQGQGAPSMTQEELDTALSRMAISVVNQFGNMRLDAMTMNISSDINTRGQDQGHIAYVMRGKVDFERMIAALEQAESRFMGPDSQEKTYEQKVVNGQTVHIIGRWSKMALIQLGDDRLVVIAGPRNLDKPIDQVTAAIQKPKKAGLAANKAMWTRVKKADKKDAVVWATGIVPAGLKNERFIGELFSGLETLDGTLKLEGKNLVLNVVGEGKETDPIKANVEKMKELKAEGVEEMQREIDRGSRHKSLSELGMKMLKPMMFTADGKKASFKMTLDRDTAQTFFPIMMGSMMVRRQVHMERRVQPMGN